MKKFYNQQIVECIVLIGFVIAPLELCSQDLVSMMPQAHNPAFVGAMNAPRISVVNPMGASAFGKYSTQRGITVKMIAYDQTIQFENAFSLGLGLRYSNIRNKELDLGNLYSFQLNTVNNFCVTLAPKFKINEKSTLSIGTDFIVQNYKYEYPASQNQFEYRTDPGAWVSAHMPDKEEVIQFIKSKVRMKAGVLYNTEKEYLGLAYRNYDIFKELNVQVGRTFQRSEHSKFSFTPSLTASFFWDLNRDFFQKRNGFQWSNVNFQFRWNKNYFGTNNVGLFYARQIKNCRLAISYTTPIQYKKYSIDKRIEYSRGETIFHVPESYTSKLELSAGYVFKKKKKE